MVSRFYCLKSTPRNRAQVLFDSCSDTLLADLPSCLSMKVSIFFAGVSLKTQELYLLVFVTRYLDLFQSYISLYVYILSLQVSFFWRLPLTFYFVTRYNSCMKFIFIVSSGCIIGYMRKHKVVSQTYDAEQDTFRVAFLVWPSFLLAAVVNQKLSVMEILWTFSIYLESVAILPQLVLLQRTKNVDNLTSNYVFLLGSYRGLYLLNWIYRCLTEEGYRQWIVWISGLLQTAIYCDFFYYYLKSWRKNERLSLPS